MAQFRFEVSPAWEKKLMQMETGYDNLCKKMLEAGTKVAAAALKSTKFGKYVRVKKPKRNQYGWFAQVQFNGKTSSGAPASLAATVYEYGRQGKNPQPARPEIRAKIQAAESAVVEAMEAVLEEELN
ncbi:MAG: hypothetical protein AAGU74_08300 [Bacillota bacterium]